MNMGGVACIPERSDHGWYWPGAPHYLYRCSFCGAWRVPQPDKVMPADWKPTRETGAEHDS
jgi:hypothetical protein